MHKQTPASGLSNNYRWGEVDNVISSPDKAGRRIARLFMGCVGVRVLSVPYASGMFGADGPVAVVSCVQEIRLLTHLRISQKHHLVDLP